ncbi:MAG: FtsQ-type POTRA domain-containing protein, partial [Nakamurella sp.]
DRVEALPGVEDATVGRHWPGTVTVTVTPRAPVAVVAANSALYLMDASGLPYDTVASRPAGLVSLRLATPGPTDPATLAGVAVVRALPPELVASVMSVTAAGPYDVTLQLTGGRTVVWGDTTDNARKAQILPAVLGLAGTRFDISDPELVTTR